MHVFQVHKLHNAEVTEHVTVETALLGAAFASWLPSLYFEEF
jgi:hypothetical protein